MKVKRKFRAKMTRLSRDAAREQKLDDAFSGNLISAPVAGVGKRLG
jgi:hypothetical protein